MKTLHPKVIGWTTHLAERGAYRTLCGKSVELGMRIKATRGECEQCHRAADAR